MVEHFVNGSAADHSAITDKRSARSGMLPVDHLLNYFVHHRLLIVFIGLETSVGLAKKGKRRIMRLVIQFRVVGPCILDHRCS
jgi:hypothetical protein